MSALIALVVATTTAAVPNLIDRALAPEASYLAATTELRRTVLENPGTHHREAARQDLVRLLLLRQEGPVMRSGSFEHAITAPDVFAAELEPRLVALYQQSDDPNEATALAKVIASNAPLGERLLAANSLALTGVVPGQALIDLVVKSATGERDRILKIEEFLVIAAFAERSKDAFQRFKQLLLDERDCGLAEAVALSLPSHDLKLVLYKKLGAATTRAAQLKSWVRGQASWSACR